MLQLAIINKAAAGRAIIYRYDEQDPELCVKFWRNGEFKKYETVYGFNLEYALQQAREKLDSWLEGE